MSIKRKISRNKIRKLITSGKKVTVAGVQTAIREAVANK